MQQVIFQLFAYAGLQLPEVNAPFVLVAYALTGGYGGILYQEETIEGKSSLVPIGCISTTKKHKLEYEVEQTLEVTLYSF